MEIKIDYIRYHITFEREELNPWVELNRATIKDKIREHDGILDCKVSDHGLFVLINIDALQERPKDEISMIARSGMNDYLKKS